MYQGTEGEKLRKDLEAQHCENDWSNNNTSVLLNNA